MATASTSLLRIVEEEMLRRIREIGFRRISYPRADRLSVRKAGHSRSTDRVFFALASLEVPAPNKQTISAILRGPLDGMLTEPYLRCVGLGSANNGVNHRLKMPRRKRRDNK